MKYGVNMGKTKVRRLGVWNQMQLLIQCDRTWANTMNGTIHKKDRNNNIITS